MSESRSKEGGFQWAVKTGDLNTVKDYVEKQGHKVNVADTTVQKRFPLHYAADMGQAAIIEYLISKGAKVNVTDAFGITPLLAAVYEGHTDAVKLLLKHGADTKAKGPDGQTALQAAEKDEIKTLLSAKR
eukprot:TRINITY_DN1408_c0_g2_i1.p1 TRINITY_DN1408_c0_g2~~TRINITY_DN1408_c0_g2_i1.p1  ORF type:complete len:130 (-),score=32.53 TRINITY_DN1408_c0_g2_i1:26-415(-)